MVGVKEKKKDYDFERKREAIKIKIPQASKLRRTHFSFVVVYWLMGSGQQVEISSFFKKIKKREKERR